MFLNNPRTFAIWDLPVSGWTLYHKATKLVNYLLMESLFAQGIIKSTDCYNYVFTDGGFQPDVTKKDQK